MDITALLSTDLLTRPTGNTASAEGGDFADVMGNLLAKAGQAELPAPPVGAKPLAKALGTGGARPLDAPLPPRSLLAQVPPLTRNTADQPAPIGPATETESEPAATTNPQNDPELAAMALAQPPIAAIAAPGAQLPRDDVAANTDAPEVRGAIAPAPETTLPANHNPALAAVATPPVASAIEQLASGGENRPTRVNSAGTVQAGPANNALPSGAQAGAGNAPLQPALTAATPAIGEAAQTANPAADTASRAPAEMPRFAQHADTELPRHATDSPGPTDAVGGNRPTGIANTPGAGTGSAATLAQMSLSAPVASPAWQQQLGQQLGSITQRGRHQVELHLNPADLGPLSVSLKVDDQGAQAQFLSAHATVRAAVEQAIPQLREALAEQGISLGETSVGEQQRQAGGEAGNGEQNRTAARDATAEPAVDTASDDAPGAPLMAGPGVDLYA
ncbi:flagellar hook-length control protein FliK [Parahaliea mediterranea]|uniref:Flagellar hook-length control protein FliK n=1 Tax=Parahaliea mediterranea TaxID=651086 RepID=A0A939DE29_9GAMM|nr:flagellar hook-length control protein FliK [Parahaliea mediterranea]MBN7795832.1 flagellar hook-length control protein FliK [Parahaliea mediterranea]